jgi:hypothetical protein
MARGKDKGMQVVSGQASVRTADTVRRHRVGGVTLAQYAEAAAAREIELDRAEIVATFSGIQGAADSVWAELEAQAGRHGVPFVAGDLERTNRVPEWDDLLAKSRHAQAAWRDAYARALLRLLGLDAETLDGRARVELVKGSELPANALAPLARRRPGMTGLAVRPTDRRTPVPPSAPSDAHAASAAVDVGAPRVDPVVFPGEKLARVSDFVRVELAAEREPIEAVLAREGIDARNYARMVERWHRRLGKDAWLAEKHDALKHPARSPELVAAAAAAKVAAAAAPRAELVAGAQAADRVVFPGEKLARLSDFARLARAARGVNFLAALHVEGLHPVYYAHMCKRLDAARRGDATLDRAYRAMTAE